VEALEDVAAQPSPPRPTDAVLAFQALLEEHLAKREANVDLAAEREWLLAEAEKPESEESKAMPGLVGLHDRYLELQAIPEENRAPADRWELQSLADVSAFAEAFPVWFERRRSVVRSFARKGSPRKPQSAPKQTPRQRPREHAGRGRAQRQRAPAGSDDPHERSKPGNRANVVASAFEIALLFRESGLDRISVRCAYCPQSKRGTRLTLLGDGWDRRGWWAEHAHVCECRAVAA
jgi:hypothetical protein